MDVDSLKAELEEHLAKNPDDNAPSGFRDRFDALLEKYNAEEDDVPKAVWETELQQIRDEAKAAWTCCETPHAGEAHPRAEEVERPVPPSEDREIIETIDAHVNPPTAGFMQRYGLALVIIVVVLAAAYYFYRR